MISFYTMKGMGSWIMLLGVVMEADEIVAFNSFLDGLMDMQGSGSCAG